MNQFLNKPFTIDRTVRIALFVLCILAIITAISAIWEVLLPFLLAGIFAYVMMPLVRFFQIKLRVKSRGVSVFLVFLLTLSIFTFGITYLIPAIQEEITKAIDALKQHSDNTSLFTHLIPQGIERTLERQFNINKVIKELSLENIMSTGESIMDKAGGLISGTISVFSWGLTFSMGVIYFIFIMMDLEGLVNGVLNMCPSTLRPVMRDTLKEIDYYMNSYFRGQALIALSVGVLLSIGFSIIGLPLAIVLGILIGLLNFIPYMQALGVIPLGLAGILMGLQTGESIWLSVALPYIVLIIVQILQDSILVPKIMGASMGMRPSLILLALAIWGYLLGFFGLLIALPATMSLYAIYMRYILRDEAYIELMDSKINPKKEEEQKA